MKKILLISSLLIIAVLANQAYRENVNMEWQKHQRNYKKALYDKAKNEKELMAYRNFKIGMQQIILPEFNRADRCISCHVAIEDPRMTDMPQPLTTHPGDYLENHDIQKIGCTFCHDGQGRAITKDDAHALMTGKYWEKPILMQPFLQSNCSRCHLNTLEEAKVYNYGKQMFSELGCTECHKIHDKGGSTGPELTNISNASFNIKTPVSEKRDDLMEKYHHNANLAYLYESVTDPKASTANSAMPDFGLPEEEATALVVYLKSLTAERRVMDVGHDEYLKEIIPAAPVQVPDEATQEETLENSSEVDNVTADSEQAPSDDQSGDVDSFWTE